MESKELWDLQVLLAKMAALASKVNKEFKVFLVCKAPLELLDQGESQARMDPKDLAVFLGSLENVEKMETLEPLVPLEWPERLDKEELPDREVSKVSLDYPDPLEHLENLVNLENKDLLDPLDLLAHLDLREREEPLESAALSDLAVFPEREGPVAHPVTLAQRVPLE